MRPRLRLFLDNHHLRPGGQSFAAAIAALLISTTLSLAAPQASAADTTMPQLQTNQSWVEDLQRSPNLKIASVDEALDFVFKALAEEVTVYPTENYYYFRFVSEGVQYAGNLRLAAQDRDQGIIHFAYFADANAANESGEMHYKALSTADGVRVEKRDALSYSVTYKGKTVVFNLNDVSAQKPAPEIVADGEEYIGLVFDESGIQFFLLYNRTHKIFTYILNETVPVLDKLTPLEKHSRVSIGHRTGFAFYQHHHLNRKVLIGVHGGNTIVNNYYDGPADQLPENFLKGDNLKSAIESSDPDMKGLIDNFGNLTSGEGRYLIAPYEQYTDVVELDGFDVCASDPKIEKALYDACFISNEDED